MCLKMASEYHEAGLPADLPYGPDLRDGEVGSDQLQRLADGCHELALRLTKLEILVFTLDSVIESLQDQLRWLPQRDVRGYNFLPQFAIQVGL